MLFRLIIIFLLAGLMLPYSRAFCAEQEDRGLVPRVYRLTDLTGDEYRTLRDQLLQTQGFQEAAEMTALPEWLRRSLVMRKTFPDLATRYDEALEKITAVLEKSQYGGDDLSPYWMTEGKSFVGHHSMAASYRWKTDREEQIPSVFILEYVLKLHPNFPDRIRRELMYNLCWTYHLRYRRPSKTDDEEQEQTARIVHNTLTQHLVETKDVASQWALIHVAGEAGWVEMLPHIATIAKSTKEERLRVASIIAVLKLDACCKEYSGFLPVAQTFLTGKSTSTAKLAVLSGSDDLSIRVLMMLRDTRREVAEADVGKKLDEVIRLCEKQEAERLVNMLPNVSKGGDILVYLSKSTDLDIRRLTVFGLRWWKHPNALQALKDMKDSDPDEHLRVLAKEAFESLNKEVPQW